MNSDHNPGSGYLPDMGDGQLPGENVVARPSDASTNHSPNLPPRPTHPASVHSPSAEPAKPVKSRIQKNKINLWAVAGLVAAAGAVALWFWVDFWILTTACLGVGVLFVIMAQATGSRRGTILTNVASITVMLVSMGMLAETVIDTFNWFSGDSESELSSEDFTTEGSAAELLEAVSALSGENEPWSLAAWQEIESVYPVVGMTGSEFNVDILVATDADLAAAGRRVTLYGVGDPVCVTLGELAPEYTISDGECL